MNQKGYKIKNKLVSISTSISSFLIPIFQYVPCTAVWFGIMSVPVITYITLFFQNPGILLYDLMFLFRTPGTYIALVGFTFYIYALIFQITHRKELIRNGPYKFVRHPQYLAFIIMTFGMTLVAFQTYPPTYLDRGSYSIYNIR
jgi:protein-S-isoprenylcysteine O-methyltransferase Ste14